MQHRLLTFFAPLTLTLAFLGAACWGCTNLSPSSECNVGAVQCDGTTAMRCEAVGGGKSSFDTHNEWTVTDCAAEGMLCVTDDTDDVGCALSDTPCDPAEAATRCEDGKVVACTYLFTSETGAEEAAFEVATSCSDGLTCQQGSVRADCAEPGSSTCDPSQEGTCEGDAVMRCSEAGLGGPVPCEPGSTCEPQDNGFSFCSAGTCDTLDATTCDADTGVIFSCWQAPGAGDETLYLRPTTTCANGCQDTEAEPSCIE